jgi:hypothetical protein
LNRPAPLGDPDPSGPPTRRSVRTSRARTVPGARHSRRRITCAGRPRRPVRSLSRPSGSCASIEPIRRARSCSPGTRGAWRPVCRCPSGLSRGPGRWCSNAVAPPSRSRRSRIAGWSVRRASLSSCLRRWGCCSSLERPPRQPTGPAVHRAARHRPSFLRRRASARLRSRPRRGRHHHRRPRSGRARLPAVHRQVPSPWRGRPTPCARATRSRRSPAGSERPWIRSRR